MRSVIVFQFRFIRQKFFMQRCHLIFIGLRRQWIEKISLLQCNDTHLHGTLKGWKFIVCFRVWQLAILQMGYPHCNINKLYRDDTKHNRGKRKPLITHQKVVFLSKTMLLRYKFIFVYNVVTVCVTQNRNICCDTFVWCL